MKKALILTLAIALMVSFASPIFAAEGKKSNPIVNFFRGLFTFPAKTIEKSVDVTAETGKAAADIGVKAIENTRDMVTGEPKKIKDLVVDPIKGVGKTAVEASKAALVPVEAAKESFPPKE